MSLHDLTPQMRTRLTRVDRFVGLFVFVAVTLMLAGFVYYLYHTAQRRGWFVNQAPYFVYVQSAAGLKVGDPVKLMGFDVGKITVITAEDPETPYNVYIEFVVHGPYYGYIWNDSRVRITTADLLGNRVFEVTKGGGSLDRFIPPPGVLATYREQNGEIVDQLVKDTANYVAFTQDSAPYWLDADESPALSVRLEQLALQIEEALPDVLGLTNQLAGTLRNAEVLITDLQDLTRSTRPISTNLAALTSQLRTQEGVLGDWLIPSNLNARLDEALASGSILFTNLNQVLASTEPRLEQVLMHLGDSLENLSNLTSNLNAQVQANTNLIGDLSNAIRQTDEFVSGLKTHWLFRSAFDHDEEPRPLPPPPRPLRLP
jgi:ABC-type transporter Mla subunit MlaD